MTPAIVDGRFVQTYTERGDDASPAFDIYGLDEGAQALALTLQDMTHPLLAPCNHWIAWNFAPVNHIEGGIKPSVYNEQTGVSQGLAYG